MKQWYVLSTVSGREQEALELLKQRIAHPFWCECRILKKIRVFRSGGILRLLEDVMFPGYVLIKTDCPEKLARELERSGDFPQPLKQEGKMIPLEPADLDFLQSVCGENLQSPMGVTRISLSGDKRIVGADGVLAGYLNQIAKLNLHKRFAVVEVELFNRRQSVLFGVQLEKDQAG